jgi:hypothetical protein
LEDSVKEKQIGLLIGDEWSWPPAFINEVNRRKVGVRADMVKLDGTQLAESSGYHVIVDRISHEIPYYRIFLKTTVLAGTTVINNPLWSSANDRFFNASAVQRMGFAHPRAVALPTHSYVEGVLDGSLRNLNYPIPWEQHIEYLGGFPVVLRSVREGGSRRVYILDSYEELWRSYDKTGAEPMMLREHICWDKYVRCLCIGSQHVLPVRYTPGPASGRPRYQRDDSYLTLDERQQVIESARRINRALGYDINAIDFAFQDGMLYAVDVTNPVPEFDVNALTPHIFDWLVKAMADFTIGLALSDHHQWHEFPWGREVSTPASARGTSEGVMCATPIFRPVLQAPSRHNSRSPRQTNGEPVVEDT